ncbi:hypothetical protein [Deinococcus sonorensis]|uniref:Uncharacterized protein n=2 Tax=Deinococcus sonorensis TaxID=309891 RepID=A0AAU7U923_9DEIO
MIDSIVNTLRRGALRAQRRGEEVAQAARLRVEIFQLGREMDALYARLGRAYHGNAEVSVLEEIRLDISRLDQEISAREQLLSELNEPLAPDPVSPGPHVPPPSITVLSPVPPADASTALSVWQQKEASRMTDPDPTKTAGRSPDAPQTPDPTMEHTDAKPPVHDAAVGVGNDAERDRLYRHPNELHEGEMSTRDPDPLANKQ